MSCFEGKNDDERKGRKNVELGEMMYSGFEMNSVQFIAANEKKSSLLDE